MNDNKKTSILFAGDVMLGRSVMGQALDNNDFYYPFRKTADFLSSADITFLNLENPIIKDCQRHSGGFKFCTNFDIANGLSFAGIDIVTLANNHSANYGQERLAETKKFLSDLNIKWVDGNNCEIIEKNGTKFGFLGFNYTYGYNNLPRDLDKITKCRPLADILIVGPHWGIEYRSMANELQVNAARQMMNSGADIIVGHHPHWVQNYEEYQGKPIYYSLGNFIFDQMWSEETKKGLVVKMTFSDKRLIEKEEFKTYIKNTGQPEIVKE